MVVALLLIMIFVSYVAYFKALYKQHNRHKELQKNREKFKRDKIQSYAKWQYNKGILSYKDVQSYKEKGYLDTPSYK